MWCAGAKFIEEYEKCLEDWFKKNKRKDIKAKIQIAKTNKNKYDK